MLCEFGHNFNRITDEVTAHLGFEDDVCIGLIMNLLEDNEDPKKIYVELSGFLEDGTFKFMKKLWTMLVSAQESMGGIPQAILDKAKENIRKDRLDIEMHQSANIEKRRVPRRSISRFLSLIDLPVGLHQFLHPEITIQKDPQLIWIANGILGNHINVHLEEMIMTGKEGEIIALKEVEMITGLQEIVTAVVQNIGEIEVGKDINDQGLHIEMID